MSIPTTQQALAIPAYLEPYTLITRPVPKPGKGDVLVRVEAIGLNPAEYHIKKETAWIIKEYPALTGTDGAGVVVDKGEDVQQFEVGDRVLFQGWFEPDRSTYQQFTLAYADRIAKFPLSISFAEAASMPLGLASAAFGLTLPYTPNELGGAGLKPFWEEGAKESKSNQVIIVLGGSSSVGQFVLQIAKYMGFSTILTTASTRHEGYLKSLGATHVIDRHVDVAAYLKSVHPSFVGADLIFDAVHTPIGQAEVDLLAPGGLIVTIWVVPKDGIQWDGGRRASYFYGNIHLHPKLGVPMYQALERFLEDGIIKPNRVEKLPNGLAGIVGGLDRLERREISGIKLVACPPETPSA